MVEVGEDFACGYSTIDDRIVSPCPSSDDFPSVDEYKVVVRHAPDERNGYYTVAFEPQTERAKALRLDVENGRTEEQATERSLSRYNL